MSKLKPYGIIWSGTCDTCGLYVSGSGKFIPEIPCPNVVSKCNGTVLMKKKLVVDSEVKNNNQ